MRHNRADAGPGPRLRRAVALLRIGTLSLGGAIAMGGVAPAVAQQEVPQVGALTGQVVNAQTGEPIPNAQIVVHGTTRAVLSGTDGHFRVGQLRPGSYRVEARSVGYRSGVETAHIAESPTAEVTFRLAVSAVALDEIVATGQPGAIARREIGNAVASINTDALEDAPVFTTSQLMQARAPGVEVFPTGGKAGQGSRILLRGVTSITQDVHPIVYLDGVRIDNSFMSGIETGGATWIGLDDLVSEDIERIEIVRGASAATLYGTEAAGGVIQIFTKQGRGGPQQVTYRSEFGVSNSARDAWDVSPHGEWYYDTFMRQGRQHRQHVSARGTLDRFSYYASGSLRNEEGVLVGNSAQQRTFRANMRVAPLQNLSIAANVGFGQRDITLPYDGLSPYGLGYHALLGGDEGVPVGEQTAIDVARLPELETAMQSTRFTAGATLNYQPFDNFTARLLLGSDIFNTDNTEWHGYGTSFMEEGMKANHRRQSISQNVDFGATYVHQLGATTRSSTSVGFQSFSRDDTWNWAYGERFVGPGLFTVAVTGAQTSDDDRIYTRHAGFYLEEQLGFNNIFFLTVGGRMDGHSAFGSGNRWHFYPKAGASYLASEHLSLPDALGTLRLRASYGAAGRQPEEYVASRTWRPVPAVGVIAVTTGNPGNPDLAPEISHEFEGGIDAGLFGDRVGVELTYYDQRTDGALIEVQYAPSTGWIDPRFENVGDIRNQGVEATLRARVLQTSAITWDTRVSASTNRNRVESLGGQEPIHIFGAQWIRPGYPAGGFFADREVQADEGIELVQGDYIGPAMPTRSLQLESDVAFGGFRVAMLAEHRGGHFLESNTFRLINSGGDPGALVPDRSAYVEPADFWRLRELSLAYDVGGRMAEMLPFHGATISLAGRNLLRSQNYRGTETEALVNPLISLGRQTAFDTPLPRQIVAGVTLQF